LTGIFRASAASVLEICQHWGFSQPEAVRLGRLRRELWVFWLHLLVIFASPDLLLNKIKALNLFKIVSGKSSAVKQERQICLQTSKLGIMVIWWLIPWTQKLRKN
jgi:hypothetical protein